MKIVKTLFIFFFLSLITGCSGDSNYRELNDLAITSVISIDKNDNNYTVTAQIINAKKAESSSSEQQSQINSFKSNGESVLEALRKLSLDVPKRIYVGHLKLIIISDEVAKEGITEIVDFFLRDPETRKEFNMAISTGSKAEDVLKITTPIEDFPGDEIIDSIRLSSSRYGGTIQMLLDDYIARLLKEGISPYVPLIKIVGNEEEGNSKENVEGIETKTSIVIEGVAIFQGDKMVSTLSSEEAMYLNAVSQELKRTVFNTSCEEGHTLIEISGADTKLKFDKGKNEMTVNISLNGDVAETNCNINLDKDKTINQIEEEGKKQFEENTLAVIEKIQKEAKADVFGFGNHLYKRHYEYWQSVKDDWENRGYQALKINLKVNLKIHRKGAITSPIKEEIANEQQ